MIISVSRRTDIPSYYSEWFFNRLNAGYAYVRNPMNPHRISEVSLSPDVVDGIVHHENDVEDKLVMAPEGVNFTQNEIAEQVHFQEQYYKTEIEIFDPKKYCI